MTRSGKKQMDPVLRRRIGLFGGIFLVVVLVVVAILVVARRDDTSTGDETETTNSDENMADGASDEVVDETEEVLLSANGVELTTAQAAAFSDVEIETENHYNSNNCTTGWGPLTLINPNFTVETAYITTRRSELVNIADLYGIQESGNNGDGYLDAEAAKHLYELVEAYAEAHPGHELTTRSCFRSVGTTCGRLCAATGTSDHHSGYTCDLIDTAYGTTLSTDDYNEHLEWQWLRAHAHEYGFIDRFPEAWAGGSMDEAINVDENGTTGLFETWHYRYVGVAAATEIATGKYNNGEYDSLEHYLLAIGALSSLTEMVGSCEL